MLTTALRSAAAVLLLLSWSILHAGDNHREGAGPLAGEAVPEAPSLRSFPKTLLSNLGGLFSTSNIKPLVIGGIATGAALTVDDQIEEYVLEKRRLDELGNIGHVLANRATLGAASGLLLLSSYLGEKNRFKTVSFDFAQGLVIETLLVHGMKAAIARERPNGENKNAFPSGHTSAAFMVTGVVSHHYPAATLPGYIVATLIGLSRLERTKHHLSDVIAGATMGYIIGRTVVRRERDESSARRVTYAPILLPRGGAGVAVSVLF